MSGALPARTASAVDWQHPYPGLKAFSESDTAFFCGRKEEELELFRMVKRLVLTTCFGASGLGKTSLLNAGLFPRLREAQFFPIAVRLDFASASGSLASQILRRMAEDAGDRKVETAAPRDGETLWEYFHRAQFWDSASRLLTPVLVLDQFEEIFTVGASDARVDPLVRELADLIENRIPISEQQRFVTGDEPPPFSLDRQHYRVIFSLREDYLPHLEDFLAAIPSLARNRFRLTAMDGSHALEAILLPGKEIVTEDVALEILRVACGRNATEGVADLRTALDRLRVEPTLLSLFCHELNVRRVAAKLERITPALLIGASDQIVSEFYERSMKDRKPAVRRFVETFLLTGSGFRRAEAVEEAIRLPGVTTADIDELVNQRLLRTEKRLGIPHVELIHDVLTKVVATSRDERLQEEARRRLRRRIAGVGALSLVVILVLVWWGWKAQDLANRAQQMANREKALQARLALQTNMALAGRSTGPPSEAHPRPEGLVPLGHTGPAIEERPRAGAESAPDVCHKYNLCGYTRDRWRQEFLRDVKPGTWHVFVLSLTSASEAQADAAKKSYQDRFKDQDFAVMETANVDGTNHIWAIVIATGLDNAATANRIVGFTRDSGIEKNAFKWQQPY